MKKCVKIPKNAMKKLANTPKSAMKVRNSVKQLQIAVFTGLFAGQIG